MGIAEVVAVLLSVRDEVVCQAAQLSSICDVRRRCPFSCSANSQFAGAVCWFPKFLVRRSAR
jgi:hypothetical protein